MRCKMPAFYAVVFSVFTWRFFGERQMVIWLDSNSNLCEKESSMDFFLSMVLKKQKQKSTSSSVMAGNQPETSIFQLMSLFVLEFAIFTELLLWGYYSARATAGPKLRNAKPNRFGFHRADCDLFSFPFRAIEWMLRLCIAFRLCTGANCVTNDFLAPR